MSAENNGQRKVADGTSETDDALILGRFSKDEWENVKWQADSISLTGKIQGKPQ